MTELSVRPVLATPAEVAAIRSVFAAGAAGTSQRQRRSTRTEIECRGIARVCEPDDFEQLGAVHDRMVTAMAADGWAELSVLAEMRVGDCHEPHADAWYEDASGDWVAHPPWFRPRGALLYLDTHGVDFEGGVLRFIDSGHEIKPTAGLFVSFPGDVFHEVTEVTSGRRRSLSVWLTGDARHRRQIS